MAAAQRRGVLQGPGQCRYRSFGAAIAQGHCHIAQQAGALGALGGIVAELLVEGLLIHFQQADQGRPVQHRAGLEGVLGGELGQPLLAPADLAPP